MSKGLTRLALVSILVVAALLSGCFGRERVMVPPKNDLGGAESIAVIYFENYTDNRILATMLKKRSRENFVSTTMLLNGEVERALAELGLRRDWYPPVMKSCALAVSWTSMPSSLAKLGSTLRKWFRTRLILPGCMRKGRKPSGSCPAYKDCRELHWAGHRCPTGNILYTRRAEGESSEFRNTTPIVDKSSRSAQLVLIPSPSDGYT